MKRRKRLLPQNSARPHPRRSLRIHGTIARQLGIAIVSSEQFSVSRTAYREALRILAAKGLIDARPKVGTRINPRSQWNFLDTDVLEWIFETEPDAPTLNALFELRELVEPVAAGAGGFGIGSALYSAGTPAETVAPWAAAFVRSWRAACSEVRT